MNTQPGVPNREREVEVFSGWTMLVVNLVVLIGGAALLIDTIVHAARGNRPPEWLPFAGAILLIILGAILMRGLFTLQPNEARVLILFGAYKGTARKSGFHWANPFYSNGPGFAMPAGSGVGTSIAAKQGIPHKTFSRYKISLRSRNLNGEKLKVNDKRGNPIEIAAVVVWRVQDTAQATFDVEDYEHYVRVQSESAVRHLASSYAYDRGEDDEITLRSGVDEVSLALRKELQDRLNKAGVFC